MTPVAVSNNEDVTIVPDAHRLGAVDAAGAEIPDHLAIGAEVGIQGAITVQPEEGCIVVTIVGVAGDDDLPVILYRQRIDVFIRVAHGDGNIAGTVEAGVVTAIDAVQAYDH